MNTSQLHRKFLHGCGIALLLCLACLAGCLTSRPAWAQATPGIHVATRFELCQQIGIGGRVIRLSDYIGHPTDCSTGALYLGEPLILRRVKTYRDRSSARQDSGKGHQIPRPAQFISPPDDRVRPCPTPNCIAPNEAEASLSCKPGGPPIVTDGRTYACIDQRDKWEVEPIGATGHTGATGLWLGTSASDMTENHALNSQQELSAGVHHGNSTGATGQEPKKYLLLTVSYERGFISWPEGGGPSHPVDHVRWFDDAESAVKWMNENLIDLPAALPDCTYCLYVKAVEETFVGLYAVSDVGIVQVSTGKTIKRQKTEIKEVEEPVMEWSIAPKPAAGPTGKTGRKKP